MRGKKKGSALGVFIGIIWGISIILIVFAYNRSKTVYKMEVPEYAISPDTMLDALDRQDYLQFQRYIRYAKEDGITKDTSEIYAKLFAVSDYIDSVAFEAVFLLEDDSERVDYYEAKRQEALNNVGNLEFVINEINNSFLNR